MEELRDPRLAERTCNGEARSLRGCGARPVSSAAARLGDYSEIFGGFASSCSIPVLMLPEAIDGYGEAFVEPQSLNYWEIFGNHDAGTFPLCYEELVSMRKGSKEEDDRFQEEPNVDLVETGAPVLQAAVPFGDHIRFSKVNQTFSSFNLSLDAEQLNISGRTNLQGIVDEVKSKICSSMPQSNYESDFEDETVSSTGFIEVESPKEFSCDVHNLHGHGYMEQERDEGKQRELNKCFVGVTVDHIVNDPKPLKYSTPEHNAENLKQHSRSSSYHSASSGDVPFSDYSFLTISDINLHTQPLQVPPPSRAPPKLDMKQEMSKSEALKAPNTTFGKELISEPYKSYHAHHIGGPRTRHALKETVKTNSPVYLNVEVDASSAAAASAAAMIEAMEQAQASLKCAKELMERKRDSPHSEKRPDHHDFVTWNGQNVNFTGRSSQKTKTSQKAVLNQVERVNSLFSEDAEEPIQGKESRLDLLSDEKGRSHEWKIDKQFYELVSNEKLMRSRVTNDEKYNNNGTIKLAHQLNAYQFFPEKEACGKQRKMFSQSNIENEAEKFNQYRISEKTLYSGCGMQLQDGNAKKIKFGETVDNVKNLDILETSAVPSLQGDDEDKQKVGPVLQVYGDKKLKVDDTINLIQRDKNANKLKECQESHTCGEGEKNEDDTKESNAHRRKDSSFVDFHGDSKLEDFDGGEPARKTLGQDKEYDEINGISMVSEYDPLSTYERFSHLRKVCNSTVTSEFTVNKFEAELSSLQNENMVEVDTEYRTSFSIDKETNLEDVREELQFGKLKKTRREIYNMSGKDYELEDIDNASEKEDSGSFSDTDKTSDEKNEKKLRHEIRAELNMPNRSEVKVAKISVRTVLGNAKEALEFQQSEGKKVYELPQKLDDYVDKLTAGVEQRDGNKHFVGKVQAALELEKKIKGLNAGLQVLQRNRVQDYEGVQQTNPLDKIANILGRSLDASGSSLKQMEKNIGDETRDADYIRKEVLDIERKEAEQKRMLEEERAREREKDRISVEKTGESCEKVFAEARERPQKIAVEWVAADARHKPIAECSDITEKSSAKASERSEKIANEAKLRAERAAVERATAEARERFIERALAEQASLEAKTQAETLVTTSKDKTWKDNVSEVILSPSNKVTETSPKPNFNVYDAPVEMKSQSAYGNGESPLRCKARQERYQRIVERSEKALAEKNMRDLVAQRERAERNRLAESLDAEVRRWSSGKEGNLRALLSTLQYILGHDSGWQPIPLTEVITAAAVRKVYRKATLYVHPDKLQQRGASIQHKYICEKVFDLLKDAWNKFCSEGR